MRVSMKQLLKTVEQPNAKITQKIPAEVVTASRDINRLTTSELAKKICDVFYEMHGDRRYGDDGAIVGGVGQINGRAVTIVGTEKGHSVQENIKRNFGSPHAEGYRKAIRLFEQAEKFNRPVITIVNTSGAFCDVEAEDRGIGQAIAESMQTMAGLTVPTITILMGEGGSGGALALAVSNKVWMMENAMYSVLSPEGFATILWKDPSRVPEAAEYMKFTAPDLLDFKVIDQIIPEHYGKKALDHDVQAQLIKEMVLEEFDQQLAMSKADLIAAKEARFNQF
ncbi:acetyl-CoA carboxylase carboxyl transferase subunit alpha [Carnobacterium sp. PL24RED07]|uniref:carboxyltransferase subunit alpha n=2 Tax=Bacilli TaxID=91061 RepID=UPI0009E4D0BB|nr:MULTISPECIES: carboxyltransferase subunit alpha [unclassified Carnobacterium]KAF3299879.1 acetyl-CoA carboxylase carboxyl transferase subunit alpha [Carnobacterium sp. PL26RED25]KAF3303169.1 acetyl-CoA carboxylase carboxyl transferase subunit alpha [Carnobacterium sp. PL17RED31]KAF3304641.1 acetyl-CoA carboxylase carboxyl transferase subunit alpha [Carnobacterium sp. PL24RED07]